MLRFKQFDWIFQLVLIVFIPLFFLINRHAAGGFNFIFGYFIVGGWQVISIIVHFFFPREVKLKSRMIHLFLAIVLVLVAAIMVATDNDLVINFLVGVLFITPALAILYLVTCYLETKALISSRKDEFSFDQDPQPPEPVK